MLRSAMKLPGKEEEIGFMFTVKFEIGTQSLECFLHSEIKSGTSLPPVCHQSATSRGLDCGPLDSRKSQSSFKTCKISRTAMTSIGDLKINNNLLAIMQM